LSRVVLIPVVVRRRKRDWKCKIKCNAGEAGNSTLTEYERMVEIDIPVMRITPKLPAANSP
jgi:hypothetical protein